MISHTRSRMLRWFLGAAMVTALAWGPAAQAQQVLRVTAIPDESPTELARKAAPLVKYLESSSASRSSSRR